MTVNARAMGLRSPLDIMRENSRRTVGAAEDP